VDVDHNYYFLEMNTRLQVEHPVTEWVTGIDLVKQQFLIAAGKSLEIKQVDIQPKGHAIECRVSAEDPNMNFLPSTGQISYLLEPGGIGIRCDSGITIGGQVYPFYDPLMSKLIVWANSREEAIIKMSRALKEYLIFGVETTIPFFIRLMQNESFRKGTISTHFLEEENIMEGNEVDETTNFASAVSSLLHYSDKKNIVKHNKTSVDGRDSNWKLTGRKNMLNSL
jgi:acetyl-CoA carboxylase biotin carboxylase subunit